MEQYNKGKLFTFELVDKYEQEYNDKVTESITDKIAESYYNKGYEFFSNFEEPDYEVLSAENEYKFKIGDFSFTGKIDVETIDTIRDYKTKGKLDYKRKPKDKDNIRQLIDGRYVELSTFRQLYIYCIPYFNKYGKYPERLVLEMVKISDRYELQFNMNDFELCKQHLLNEIQKIYETIVFEKHEDDFWCNNICGQRFNCKEIDFLYE